MSYIPTSSQDVIYVHGSQPSTTDIMNTLKTADPRQGKATPVITVKPQETGSFVLGNSISAQAGDLLQIQFRYTVGAGCSNSGGATMKLSVVQPAGIAAGVANHFMNPTANMGNGRAVPTGGIEISEMQGPFNDYLYDLECHTSRYPLSDPFSHTVTVDINLKFHLQGSLKLSFFNFGRDMYFMLQSVTIYPGVHPKVQGVCSASPIPHRI
jgi:hypothetical protein